MSTLIGEISAIAIEYEVCRAESLTGFARFWLNGKLLGSFKDLVYLDGYIRGCLLDLRKKGELSSSRYLRLDDAEALFALLKQDMDSFDEDPADDFSELAWPFFLTCGTLFDCYLVFAHRTTDGQIRVLWQLQTPDDELPFHDLKGSSRAIQFAQFSAGDLDRLIEVLERDLAEIGKQQVAIRPLHAWPS